jgi:hypothetical protein
MSKPEEKTEETPTAAQQTDEEIIQELLERTSYMVSRWSEIRAQGELNMVALSITGPWPPKELSRRFEKKIPCGHTDIISWANDRVVNQFRQNPRGVKVDPSGDGASKKTAELRENRIREMAYSSQARGARICCFQNMVDRGFGAFEVYAEYESPTSSRQTLCVGRIPNPNSVLVDPDTVKADRSDKKYAVKMGQTMPVAEFKRRYPKAKEISSFPESVIGLAKYFTDGKVVTPAEYYRIVGSPDTLLTLETGQDVLKSKLPKGMAIKGDAIVGNGTTVAITKTRPTEIPRVEHFTTNGLEILARTVLPISVIPILFGVAKEKYVNDMLTVEAQTAKMREPQLNFDVARAAQMQAVNMTPKSKWVVSDEQILGYEDQWQNAHVDPQAYLVVHEYDRNGRQMAHPERTDYEPPIQGFEMAANAFLRDAQNAVGMTSTERIDRVAKSGVAQDRINEAGDVSAFHITDNMLALIEFEGRIENEWIAHIEDSERTVGLRKPDGKYEPFRLVPKQTGEGEVDHPYGKYDSHAVTISTGPDYQSQHQEKVEFIKDIIKNPEFAANPVSPLLVHEMEMGPGGDKIEKILLAVQPPAVQAAYDEGDEGREPIPPQALQAIEQLKKENAEAKEIIRVSVAKLEEIQQQLESKQLELQMKAETEREKIQANKEIEAMRLAADKFKAQIDLQIARMNNATKLAVEDEKMKHSEAMAEHNAEHADSEAERGRQFEKEMRDKEASEIG